LPGFIYIWFDRHRKKFYVGCHWGEPNDGYVCSSVHMKRAYKNRPQDFKRRILVSNIITKSMMFEEELRYLNLASKRPERYYNKQFTNDHWSADEEKSKQVRKKISESNKGKPKSEKARKNMSIAKKGKPSWNKGMKGYNAGNKNPAWKGGVKSLQLRIRHSLQYRQWVSDVFERDDYTCMVSGVRGGKLEAHHIKQFAKILEEYNIKTIEEAEDCAELWNINNGITLSKEIHKDIHKKD